MAIEYKKPVDDNVDWKQRLVNYSQNPNAGYDELKRAYGVYNSKNALGDTAGANAASTWMNQVNTALGGKPSTDMNQIMSNYATHKQNADLEKIAKMMTDKAMAPPTFQYQAPPTFSYNHQTDPRYQAVYQQAMQDANTATNNAMVALGKRGVSSDSSSARLQAQGIQQNALAKVNTELLPQFYNQAYNQWSDQANRDLDVQKLNYGVQQDQDKLLAGLAEFLSGQKQQQFDNDRMLQQDRRLNKLDNQAVAQWYTQTYGKQFDPKEDWGQHADKAKGMDTMDALTNALNRLVTEAGVTGYYNGKPTMQKQNSDISNWIQQQSANTSAANAANSSSNATFNRLRDIWETTGYAPAGLEQFGIAPGTPLRNAQKEQNQAKKMEQERSGLVTALRSGQITPAQARKTINEDQQYGFYTPEEAAELLQLTDMFVRNTGPTINQTAGALMNPVGNMKNQGR